MRCKPAEKLLLDFIEGTLPPKRKGQLENHLGKCPHCQKVLVGFEKTLQLAGSLQVNYPPAAVWEDFWPKLRSKNFAGRTRKRWHLVERSQMENRGRRLFIRRYPRRCGTMELRLIEKSGGRWKCFFR